MIGKNSGYRGGKKLSIVAIYGFVFTMDLGLDTGKHEFPDIPDSNRKPYSHLGTVDGRDKSSLRAVKILRFLFGIKITIFLVIYLEMRINGYIYIFK